MWPSWPFFPKPPGPHTPLPSPHVALPFPSTGKSHPRRSIFLLRASFSPAHTPLSHCVFPHLTRLSLSSAPAQLSSGAAHTLSLSHTLSRSRSHSRISSIFLLWAARHGRTGRHYLFIVLVAWVSCVCLHCTRCTHTQLHTRTHTHTHTLHVHIYKKKKYFIVLGLGAGLAARCCLGPRPRHRL